jgi:hypothetical protein
MRGTEWSIEEFLSVYGGIRKPQPRRGGVLNIVDKFLSLHIEFR